jgi:hypothetical protein
LSRSQGRRIEQPRDLFFTNDQLIKILRDRAIFAESSYLRLRSVVELSTFGQQAIPIIRDVIDNSIGNDDEGFKVFCHNAIKGIQDEYLEDKNEQKSFARSLWRQ